MPIDLEKYLNEQRNQLDIDKPDDNLIWEGIRNDLQTQKLLHLPNNRKKLIVRIINIAALILLMISLSYVAYDLAEKHFTKSIGKISKAYGKSPRMIRETIHKIKRNMPAVSDRTNPDVVVDIETGDVYPEGGTDPMDNIKDYF